MTYNPQVNQPPPKQPEQAPGKQAPGRQKPPEGDEKRREGGSQVER